MGGGGEGGEITPWITHTLTNKYPISKVLFEIPSLNMCCGVCVCIFLAIVSAFLTSVFGDIGEHTAWKIRIES